MITKKRQIGDLGEQIACKYLKKGGFSIIARNFQRKCGEVDVIAEKSGRIHFIEVKSVSRETVSCETGMPVVYGSYRAEDNIHGRKLARIRRTIQSYLLESNLPETCEWQFDVAIVYLNFRRRTARVKFIKDIIL